MVYDPRDSYFRKAQIQGYRSRAAYKLIELQRRFRLLKTGDRVVDLGAAPGGWLQVAAKMVGPGGKVVGVDLQPIAPFQETGIVTVQGDITTDEVQKVVIELLGGPAHCVISDLAPKLSGIRDADNARCLELNRAALDIAVRLLKPGGHFLLKSFMSNDLHAFTRELKSSFRVIERTRPDATRQASSEFYFCAKGFFRASRSSWTVQGGDETIES
jgi:23S rRNA (uridine2552-2'-O)-methyltransferase